MNGLRFIRKQCNLSVSELADRLGITRQLVSAWENDKKQIPDKRKKQMADYFGIGEEFFGEISEEQKHYLLGKAMFRYCENGEETFRYKPENYEQDLLNVYFIAERKMSIDEELLCRQQEQKVLMKKINQIISGPPDKNSHNQMCSINRGITVFSLLAQLMEISFSQKSIDKMPYYHTLVDVLEALTIALDGEQVLQGEETPFSNDPWIKKCAGMIEEHLQETLVVKPSGKKIKKDQKLRKLTKDEIDQKIAETEKEFAKEGLPDGASAMTFGIFGYADQ